MKLIYDGSCQSIIGLEETRIGPRYKNICAYCMTRTNKSRCTMFPQCLAKKDTPGAPWSLPWTDWTSQRTQKGKAELEDDIDPMSGRDSFTGYIASERI